MKRFDDLLAVLIAILAPALGLVVAGMLIATYVRWG